MISMNVEREIKFCLSSIHPNIVKLYNLIEYETHLYLVMKLASVISLSDYMKSKKFKRISENDGRLINSFALFVLNTKFLIYIIIQYLFKLN